jgi:hypothetical protein
VLKIGSRKQRCSLPIIVTSQSAVVDVVAVVEGDQVGGHLVVEVPVGDVASELHGCAQLDLVRRIRLGKDRFRSIS